MSWFLSGFLMPLRFLPAWFQQLANLTPFPSMINTVIEIYLGVLTGPAVYFALLAQLGWFVGLALLAQVILRAGMRTLVIQGG
jgi:ABC-2 type transport system permease protein